MIFFTVVNWPAARSYGTGKGQQQGVDEDGKDVAATILSLQV
jgi:hypothetical protein